MPRNTRRNRRCRCDNCLEERNPNNNSWPKWSLMDKYISSKKKYKKIKKKLDKIKKENEIFKKILQDCLDNNFDI